MALMFPACFTSKSTAAGAAGERLVYDFLRDNLPDNWIVIHDLWRFFFHTKKRYYTNYETDFIILIPGKGILVLEVKNIKTITVKDGKWSFVATNGEVSDFGTYTSPVQQAYLAAKKLKTCLDRRFEDKNIEMRPLAVLLQQKRDDFPKDPEWDDMLVFGMEELQAHLKKRIKSLFVDKKEFDTELMDEIRSFLLQTIHYTQDPKTYVGIMDREAVPQTHMLCMLENCTGGIRVDGCAGSGKTVMALTEVTRLGKRIAGAKGRQRILLLCYNRHLGQSLREHKEIRKYRKKGIIYATTFARFCDKVLEPTGESIDWRSAEKEVTRNMPVLLEEIAKHHRYDYVFVDEAQDFHPSWWPLIQHTVATGGKLYLFTDTNQSLYGHADTVPELPTRITLTVNLRNSKDIADYGHCLLPAGTAVYTLPLSVQEVHILPGAAEVEKRAETADALLRELLQKFDRRDIAVLSPWKKPEKSSLNRIPHVSSSYLGESADRALDRLNCWREGKIVFGESIRAFKGLESLVVILTDIPAPGETMAFSPNDFYVACTRARIALYIIPTLSGEPYVREILSRAQAKK